MANITKVHLLSVPFGKDYAHTVFFNYREEQTAYFQGKVKKTYTDFSYQRKDEIIRIPDHIDSLYAAGCNYVMYQNAAYSNKWFYAFIDHMEYINDGRTDVHIKTDCIQTWMFEYDVQPSFIEREHAESDAIGEHTVDEALEMGEYAANRRLEINYGSDLVIVVGVTVEPDGTNVFGNCYTGIYSGIKYYKFDTDYHDAETSGIKKLNDFLLQYDKDGKGDAIVCMFLAPKAMTAEMDGSYKNATEIPSWNYPYMIYINPLKEMTDGGYIVFGQQVMEEFSTNNIDGYIPKNRKLFAYPFRYLMVSNNAGAAAVYKFERFFTTSDNGDKTQLEPTFQIMSAITPGCSIRLIPLHYNGVKENHEEGLNMGKFPVLNWTSDAYTNWLTQNSVNIGLQLASGVGQVAAGIAVAAGTSGAGAILGGGSIIGGASQIANTLAQVHTQSFTPPQSKGNINSGDVVTANGDNTFQFYVMSVKAEYAKIIDDYFTMYGYKCHRVKTPNINHRPAFWYTKTIDANITGPVPETDMQAIKDCYNRGITFWKHTAKFGDYSQANDAFYY